MPLSKIELITKRLDAIIENLYMLGVTDFISGGALGFDQIAACRVIAKKKLGFNIRLIFALPYKNHDELWTKEQKLQFRKLLNSADEVVYVSNQYSDICLKRRNYYMIDLSDYCVCALLNSRSGTGQTIRYAQKNGLKVINVAR